MTPRRVLASYLNLSSDLDPFLQQRVTLDLNNHCILMVKNMELLLVLVIKRSRKDTCVLHTSSGIFK